MKYDWLEEKYVLDEKLFFENYRRVFKTTLKQNQVDGFKALIEYWNKTPYLDLRWFAYILATIYHETGATLIPVREGFAKTDAAARAAVASLYRRGKIKTNYALPRANGNSYYGRGWEQMTHWYNYQRQQEKSGVEYYNNPDLALILENNASRVVEAMVDGDYTGRKLSQYFNTTTEKWDSARAIINGTDKMYLIGGYARQFFSVVTDGEVEVKLSAVQKLAALKDRMTFASEKIKQFRIAEAEYGQAA